MPEPQPPEKVPEGMICLGEIVGAHGVRGMVRIRSFTERAEDISAYGPLRDATNARKYELTIQGSARGAVLAKIAEVDDRDAAEELRGTRLYVPRAALPEPSEDEYYHADLIGLRAETADGSLFGRVKTVNDYGAGDVIEVERENAEPLLLPFTRDNVPDVDLAGGRLVIEPPVETDARETPGDTDEDDGKVEA